MDYSCKNKKHGFSLIEVLVGLFLFGLLSAAIFKAFAPTATDAHNLLRGYSLAMNLANLQISKIEGEIERFGKPAIELNKKVDITYEITHEIEKDNSAIELLRNLQFFCKVTPGETENPTFENLFKIEVEINWGNREGDNRPHRFKLARWKVKPYD